MPATFPIPLIVVIPGQLITATLWNNEYNNLYVNLIPAGIDTYSNNDTQMQASTDPFPSGTSRPTSLAGEIERIRYILNLIIGQTYWYNHPSIDLETLNTDIGTINGRFPVQTVDIGDLQVTTPKIALQAVTNAQIADNTIGAGQITNNSIGAAQITNSSITETQLAASVAGNGLSGGAGTPLAVNVDTTTIQITGDTLSAIVTTIGLKSIQTVSASGNNTNGPTFTRDIDMTISSINTSKALPIMIISSLNDNTAGTVPVIFKFTVSFTSATNLRISLVAANASAHNYGWSFSFIVAEFN